MSVRILIGDVRARLRDLPDESVNCVVTSPPYWGLRDYGTARWEGGDPACDHRSPTMRAERNEDRPMLAGSNATNSGQLLHAAKQGVCGRCGARRIDLQLGMEPTPMGHVDAMVSVFREVRRILRPDGVCWVNYGDTYATSMNGRSAADTKAAGNDDRTFRDKPFSSVVGNLKPKDCCNIPERFMIAMQDDGWWVRSKLPWLKRNCMPESISDRPAVSLEWVYMFTKSARYAYNAEAVMRPISPGSKLRVSQNVADQVGSARANGGAKTNGNMKAVVRKKKQDGHGRRHAGFNERWDAKEQGRVKDNENFESALNGPLPEARNFRNADLFWLSLIEPLGLISAEDGTPLALDVPPRGYTEAHFATFPPRLIEPLILAGCPIGGTVLDPFLGAGTTALVADRLGRNCIGIELNPEYAAIAERRIKGDAGMFATIDTLPGTAA